MSRRCVRTSRRSDCRARPKRSIGSWSLSRLPTAPKTHPSSPTATRHTCSPLPSSCSTLVRGPSRAQYSAAPTECLLSATLNATHVTTRMPLLTTCMPLMTTFVPPIGPTPSPRCALNQDLKQDDSGAVHLEQPRHQRRRRPAAAAASERIPRHHASRDYTLIAP